MLNEEKVILMTQWHLMKRMKAKRIWPSAVISAVTTSPYRC